MRASLAIAGLVAAASCKKQEPIAMMEVPSAGSHAVAATTKPIAVLFVSEVGSYEVATPNGKRAAALDAPAAVQAILALAVTANDATAKAQLDDIAERDAPPRDEPPTDDSPPPPPDENGGTGAAMALDEGRMGKKDALARAHSHVTELPSDALVGALTVAVTAVPSFAPVVTAPPNAPAAAIAKVVADTGGTLTAVGPHGAILDAGFAPLVFVSRTDKPWLEVLADEKGLIVLEARERKPHALPWNGHEVDADGLGKVLVQISKPDEPITIVAGKTLTTQQLIDTVIAIRGAGWLGLRLAASDDDIPARVLTMQNAFGPIIAVGPAELEGKQLAPSKVLRALSRTHDQLTACYMTELAGHRVMGGVHVTFEIDATGAVTTATATADDGFSPVMATCVTGVIRTIAFPKPKSGAVVQVHDKIMFVPPP